MGYKQHRVLLNTQIHTVKHEYRYLIQHEQMHTRYLVHASETQFLCIFIITSIGYKKRVERED